MKLKCRDCITGMLRNIKWNWWWFNLSFGRLSWKRITIRIPECFQGPLCLRRVRKVVNLYFQISSVLNTRNRVKLNLAFKISNLWSNYLDNYFQLELFLTGVRWNNKWNWCWFNFSCGRLSWKRVTIRIPEFSQGPLCLGRVRKVVFLYFQISSGLNAWNRLNLS